MNASKVQIPLKVLMHKEEERLVFAEANADFVDILLSFLTLPLGTIFKLLSKHSSSSQPFRIGCFHNLYTSISNLEAKYFATQGCKELLLNAKNSADDECQRLKINIDDNTIDYFTCDDMRCTENSVTAYFTMYKEARCKNCLKFLNRKAHYANARVAGEGGVFVNPNESFIITNDLRVIPSIPASALSMLEDSESTDFEILEEKAFRFGYSEILDLLKLSIVSETPPTDMLLGKNKITVDKSVQTMNSSMSKEGVTGFKKMTVKIWFRKSSKKILFAHCTEEFIDFLFSLLTVPLGRVISVLSKDDGLASCVQNMHQSVSELSVGEYLKSQQMKDMLLCPQVSMLYQCSSQLFPLQEDEIPKIFRKPKSSPVAGSYVLTSNLHSTFRELKLASPKGERGFLMGSTKFMVTDDLVVTPFSSMSCMKYIQRYKVPATDIDEQVIDIGIKEAVNILRASLISTSVLTNGLQHLIQIKPKTAKSVKKPKIEK